LLQVTSRENNVTNPLNLDTNRCVETYPGRSTTPAFTRSTKKGVEKSSGCYSSEECGSFTAFYRVL